MGFFRIHYFLILSCYKKEHDCGVRAAVRGGDGGGAEAGIKCSCKQLQAVNECDMFQSGILRWFQDGPRLYAPKELVIRHMLSGGFQGIGRKSAKHEEIIRRLSEIITK